jgi:hypothetical protein
MNLSERLVERFHQTPVSAVVRKTPGVKSAAGSWWLRTQTGMFRAAMSTLSAPQTPASAEFPVGLVNVPTRSDAAMKLPPYVLAGEDFSDAMAQWCFTSKFISVTRAPGSEGYQDIYAPVLSHLRGRGVRVLEVGIGINDPTARSGMGSNHVPGASLMGWSHYLEGSEVHGADIDERCLVDTEWYTTHKVDQKDPVSLAALASELGAPLDLIVDDGLHTPEANGNTVAALLPLLSPSGVMVVEDIPPEFDALWEGSSEWLGMHYGISYFPWHLLRQIRAPGYRGGIAILTRRA